MTINNLSATCTTGGSILVPTSSRERVNPCSVLCTTSGSMVAPTSSRERVKNPTVKQNMLLFPKQKKNILMCKFMLLDESYPTKALKIETHNI